MKKPSYKIYSVLDMSESEKQKFNESDSSDPGLQSEVVADNSNQNNDPGDGIDQVDEEALTEVQA